MKEKKVRLKLENVYGGDGFVRPERLKENVYSDKQKKVTIRQDIGIPVEDRKTSTMTREKDISINTFKRDGDGAFLYRLGGTHGKLWGAMREAGYSMADSGQVKSKSLVSRLLRSVQIIPQWIKLEMKDGIELQRDGLPQITAGMNRTMIMLYYDVIPECETEIVLRYPEEFEKYIVLLLEGAQTVNFGNKRRGVLTVLNMEDMKS